MNGLLAGVLAFLVAIAAAIVGELLSEEIRGRLDQIPHGVLRLAARRLDPAQRATVYHDEWLPELTYILKGAEARPITRLSKGTWYAFGIFVNTRRIARHLHRPVPGQAQNASASPHGTAGNFRSFPVGRELLAYLAGGRPEILARCPDERFRFESLALVLLGTCALTVVSMWFAAEGAVGINAVLAVPFAIGWGLCVVSIRKSRDWVCREAA